MSEGQLLTVPTRANGTETKLVIDTGSAVNVISEELANKICASFKSRKDIFIRGIGGGLLTPNGEAEIKLEFGTTKVHETFLVVKDCPYELLGGLPFCRAARLLIDFSKKELQLNGEIFRLRIDSSAPEHNDVLTVRCHEQIRIEPRTEVAIEVKVARDGIHLVEPNSTLRNGLQVARTITRIVHGRGLIRIANPTMSPVNLLSGTKLGWASSIHDAQLAITAPENDQVPQEFDIETGDHLQPSERDELLSLIEKYRHLFTSSDNPIRQTHVAEHVIDTGDSRPIHQHPYRHSPFERQQIEQQVEEMLRDGIIRESHSPWSSPVVLVKKPNGTWRFCVDFRRVNEVTKKDVHPLPRIDDILDVLQGSKYFTTLDLTSGYWQVGIKEEDKQKTAFACGPGLYEFNVVPFGLCNAPATFQRMINKVLSGLLWRVCLAYLDDIVIFSKTMATHLQDLESVFSALDVANLRLKSEKCSFARQEIKYLGHILTGESIRPDPDKVAAIEKFPKPRNKKGVQSFLGICNYYRRFIKDFSRISRPLTNLTKKDVPFVWDAACEVAMQTLKEKLITAPILRQFEPGKPIEVHTDACDYGIGAVLVQKIGTQERVVAYASRHLNKAEMNYSTTEKECLAVVYACGQFRPYVFGSKFTVVTDQASLAWLMKVRNPNGRLMRWSLLLQEFDITLRHRPGLKNGNADTLSRLPHDPAPVSEENPLPLLVLDQVDVGKKQRADPWMKEIMQHLEHPDAPVVRKTKRTARSFRLIDGVLYRRAKGFQEDRAALVVPKCLRSEILRYCHDATTAGHLGVKRTWEKVRCRYFWPKMFSYVSKYVLSCPDCQTRKQPPGRPVGFLQPIPPAGRPFQQVGMDFIGPFTKSKAGNRYIVVITDYHTKWVEAVACPAATAAEAARAFVEQIVLRHGAPEKVISDRGQHFVANLTEEIFRLVGSEHATTTAYHPQANGLCERFNRTLADMLSMYVSSHHRDWDEFLPYVLFAYNSSTHETTGFTPFFLLHGHEPTLPVDVGSGAQRGFDYTLDAMKVARRLRQARKIVNEREKRQQEKNKRSYDARRRSVVYHQGDLVYLWTPSRAKGKTTKLLHKYHGPFRLVRRVAENNWEVVDQTGKKRDVVNVARLKPCHVRLGSDADDADDESDDNHEVRDLGGDVREGSARRDDHGLHRSVVRECSARRDDHGLHQSVVRECGSNGDVRECGSRVGQELRLQHCVRGTQTSVPVQQCESYDTDTELYSDWKTFSSNNNAQQNVSAYETDTELYCSTDE